jgi:hypothetical protein
VSHTIEYSILRLNCDISLCHRTLGLCYAATRRGWGLLGRAGLAVPLGRFVATGVNISR